jgi:hypothetical protein
VGRSVLKDYEPVEGLWPSQHLPTRIAEARRKFADHPGALKTAPGGGTDDEARMVEHEVGNL